MDALAAHELAGITGGTATGQILLRLELREPAVGAPLPALQDVLTERLGSEVASGSSGSSEPGHTTWPAGVSTIRQETRRFEVPWTSGFPYC